MSSNAAKKIVVFTATGSQGSSVARYLSEAGYKVVALTRILRVRAPKVRQVLSCLLNKIKADL